jgi:predicted kinase
MRAVIFDIDGTLSDPTHRLHHVTGDNRNWDAFFGEMGADPIHEPIRKLLYSLGRHTDIILICTGRPENYREATETWLTNKGIFRNKLYMRPAGDTRQDHIVKAEMLAAIRADGYEPWLVIDDRPSVVAMWRANGLTCLQCRDWDDVPPVEPGLLTLMIGPSGAGKSSWLNSLGAHAFGIRPSQIVSSDQIRDELCGDFRDQRRNTDVFAALHAIVKTCVSHGLPTVVDATNLRRRDRLAAAALTPPTGKIRYIVLDRPEHEKRRDAGWRDDMPIDVIAKHARIFEGQLKNILAGDGLPNVEVIDLRECVS